MSKNTVTDFSTTFQMIKINPPPMSHLIPFDFTAYTTARQILSETEGGQDQESVSLNKMAKKLMRILQEGNKYERNEKNDEKDREKVIKSINKQRSPLRVDIHLEEQQTAQHIPYQKMKHSAKTKDATHSRKRTLTPKREGYCPSPTNFKDQNQNYGNQQVANKPVKKIIELMRKQYRKDDHNLTQPFIKPLQPQHRQDCKKEIKHKIVHKKSNSSLVYVSRIQDEPKLRKNIRRMQKPSQNMGVYKNSQFSNVQEQVWEGNKFGRQQKQKQFMSRLKDQFSSICCNQLNEEQKKVSEQLKVLEMRLGQIVGHTPKTNNHYEQPRVSPYRHDHTNIHEIPSTKTVRVNLTPKRGRNKGNTKSPNSSHSQLLSKRLEKAMRV